MRRIHIRLFVFAQVRLATLDNLGQTTAEYVLLILGAATIAILVTSWASLRAPRCWSTTLPGRGSGPPLWVDRCGSWRMR